MRKFLIIWFAILLVFPNVLCAENNYLTENKGQLEERVKYYSKLNNQNVIIFKNGFAYDNFIREGDVFKHHRVEIFFKEGSNKSDFRKINELDYKEHFYKENLEVTHVKSFSEIVNRNVYPGIDVKYSFNKSGKFKYDVIIHPGASTKDISLIVNGAPVRIENEELVFDLSIGDLKESIPLSYLMESGETIDVRYFQKCENEIVFKIQDYDHRKTLCIDPIPNIVWATYWGGSGQDEILTSDIDEKGNIYSGGKSNSTANISTSGAFQVSISSGVDGIISKFDVNGKRIWSTYYGGSGYDDVRRIKVTSLNEIICTANSTSSGMATSGAHQSTHAGNYDGMVLRFTDSGTRVWATYFGGSAIEDMYGLVLDKNRNIYISGKSSSSGLASSGAYKTSNSGNEDAIIVSFNINGSFRWCTYVGGSGQDYLRGMVLYPDNHLYMSGFTKSTSGIAFNAKHQSTSGGGDDGFYLKIDTSGKMKWINYFGGSGNDYLTELTSTGDQLMMAGQTTSSSGIASTGAYQTSYTGNVDGFLFSFDTSGSRNWGSYYGGSGFDEVYVVHRIREYLFIGGKTSSTNSIATSGAYQTSLSGNQDNFIIRLDINGFPIWGSYYGGPGNDMVREFQVFEGNLYMTGYTESSTQIATSGSHQSTYGGGGDAFIAKFDNLGCGANMFAKMVRPALCAADSTGIATVFVSNKSGNPSFRWKTNPPQYNDTIFGLRSGVYEVVLTDTLGCTDSIKVIVTEPIRLTAYIKDSMNISCAGSKDGRLIADATGGNSPYFFKWLTSPPISNDSITGLSAGLYKVIVTDMNNCIDSTIARIREPDTLKSVISGFNHATCFMLNNGQISVSVAGGTQPYSYVWSSSPPQYTSTAYNLTAGFYEVNITDKNGCRTKSTYTITEPSPINIGVSKFNQPICYNDSLGEIFTNIWGGTPGYKIQWNSNPSLNTSNLTRLARGTHRITVTDANNCVESRDFTLIEPNPLTIKFDSVFFPLCFGTKDGTIMAHVGGGVVPYQYYWNAPPYINVNKISGLNAGKYQLTIKDSVGCSITDSVTLLNRDSIRITAQLVSPKCFDGADGKIDASVNGGLPPYKYAWAHNTSINSPLLNNIKSGVYTLTVTDKNSCISTVQYAISQPNPLEIKKQLHKDVSCFNGKDGAISISYSGGTPPLIFRWNNPPVQTSDLNNLAAGNYTAILTDTNGCADSMLFVIHEPSALAGFFDSIQSPSCYAQSNGFVTYKAGGGVRPFEYAFDNSPFQSDSLAAFVEAGWIRVKIRDKNGCLFTDSALLIQPDKLNIQLEVSQINCFGQNNGKIIAKGSGGILPYKYEWSPIYPDTQTVFNLNPGVYSVTIFDKNNCTVKKSVQITQPEKLVSKVDLNIPASCFNVDNGVVHGSATGGIPEYEYFWKGPWNYSGQKVLNARSGSYVLIVKDMNGCLDSTSLFIGQPDKFKLTILSVNSPACVDSSNGWAEIAPLPGVGPFIYLWSNGDTLTKAENLSKGNYSVNAVDKCGDTASLNIKIEDPLPFVIPKIKGVLNSFTKNEETYEMLYTPGWIYNWEVEGGVITSGQGTPKIKVKWGNPGKGILKITVISANKCVDKAEIIVHITAECMYVYPNPANDFVQVLLPSLNENELLMLFDARGRKIIEMQGSVEQAIDISHLAEGIYFFRYKDCYIKIMKD